MKKLGFILLVTIFFLLSCRTTIKQAKEEVTYPKGLSDFISRSTMVFYQGDYWILGIPETKDILGKVIEVKIKTVEGKKFEYYEIIDESLFSTAISNTDIKKESIIFQRQEEIRTDNDAGLILLAFVTGQVKNINQVNYNKLIETAYYIDPVGYSIKEKYKNSNAYYVSKYYLGTISYIGTMQLNIVAKGGFASISASDTFTTVSSLNELKKGIVALRLSKIKSLYDKSIRENNYDDLIGLGYEKLIKLPE